MTTVTHKLLTAKPAHSGALTLALWPVSSKPLSSRLHSNETR